MSVHRARASRESSSEDEFTDPSTPIGGVHRRNAPSQGTVRRLRVPGADPPDQVPQLDYCSDRPDQGEHSNWPVRPVSRGSGAPYEDREQTRDHQLQSPAFHDAEGAAVTDGESGPLNCGESLPSDVKRLIRE